MINHVYTLLRNRDGAGVDQAQGAEYVAPGFRAAALPSELRAIRRVLFGNAPDRTYQNYRLRQYLTILHAGDYAEYLTAVDPRVTYWPFAGSFSFGASASLAPQRFPGGAQSVDPPSWLLPGMVLEVQLVDDEETEVVPVADTGSPLLYEVPWSEVEWWYLAEETVVDASLLAIQGTLAADDEAGRSEYAWRFVVPDGLTYAAGMSEPVALPGSALAVRVAQAVPVGSLWNVRATARPGRDLVDVVAALSRPGAVPEHAVFGDVSAEPGRTFRNLWFDHEQLPERLTGLLLALAARAEEYSRP